VADHVGAHGIVHDTDGPVHAYEQPRCPRCTAWDLIAVGNERWWCQGCDLVVTCTKHEWEAMADQRALWAKGEHPAQRVPEPLPKPLDVPHENAKCLQCGKPHARRPDPRAPKPKTSTPAAPARADYRRRWTTSPSEGRDPDGRPLAWPPAPASEEPVEGAPDPAAAEAALLADMHEHDRTRGA